MQVHEHQNEQRRLSMLLQEFNLSATGTHSTASHNWYLMLFTGDEPVAQAKHSDLSVLLNGASDWIRDVYSIELVDWH